jgi:dihydrofolate reductase
VSQVTLFIAVSLDGYIAHENGGVEWLPTPSDSQDFGYSAFYASVDSLVMGRRTYERVLSFGDWPYSGKPTFVLSRSHAGQADNGVTFVNTLPESAGHTWLVGGAQAIRAYADAGRIDDWIISLVPILLGQGSPLFPPMTEKVALTLQDCRTYPGGLVTLHYRNGG